MDRLFTREEAERLLPRLIPVLARLQSLHRDLMRLQREIAEIHWRARSNGKDSRQADLEQKQAEAEKVQVLVRQDLQQVEAWGVEVKDLEMGLVDFPSKRGEEVVYLCWKLGEPGIQFWHRLEDGFAGRQPL